MAAFIFAAAVFSAAQNSIQPPIWASKPDVAAFERTVKDRIAGAQSSIEKVTAVKGSRNIENTLAPFDDAVRQLNAASYLAGLMQQVHPDAPFRDKATDMVREASAAQTALALNRDVYEALAGLDVSHSDSATQYYVKRQLLEFRLAGVDKDEAARNQLKKLNDELTEEQSMFDRNISDDQKKVEVTDVK
ncbi:MAG: hypothetical protein DMG93_02295, partial [Acidobacteria bacterium]